MQEQDYKLNVLARCSKDFHTHLVSQEELMEKARVASQALDELDALKKALFYGRLNAGSLSPELYPVHTNIEATPMQQQMLHAIIGLATEAGELLDAMVMFLRTGEFDPINLQEEFGDANWYRVLGLDVLQQTETQNRAQNDSKLEARFGPAFTSARAIERDLAAERRTLEG